MAFVHPRGILMAIGSFFELAHSSSSYASFVQSAMQQISGQGSAPQAENTNGSKFAGVMTDTLSIERAKKTKEIMSGYDMTHMSRNEMIEMAGKLEKSGIITWEQFADLTSPYFDEWDENMNLITNYDQKINYLLGFQEVVNRRKMFLPDDTKSIELAQRTLALAESLYSVSNVR